MTEYTLNIFRILLDKKPLGLSEDIQSKAEEDYKKLKKENRGLDQIEKVMIEFGKVSWAYRQASLEFEEKYVAQKKEELFISSLSSDLQKKWLDFKAKGGDVHKFRKGQEFEDFFSADENLEIEDAMVEAESAGDDLVVQLASGEKKNEYDILVKKYVQEKEDILAKIEELGNLKQAGDKWVEEINQEVNFFEKGFAEIEERPRINKVQEKIDFYTGQIEVGNK